MTTIYGDFLQNGGTLALDIFGPEYPRRLQHSRPAASMATRSTAHDHRQRSALRVGDATLDGTLVFDINDIAPQTYGWYDVVVANDIRITDGTLDMQGMVVWRIITDPSNPGREILQVAIPEPASIVSFGR